MSELLPRTRTELAPGAVHVPDWLSLDEQKQLVEACREWARGPAPMRHTTLPNGGLMSVQTVCLGWHWLPYRYSRTANDVDGAPVAPFPEWLGDLGRRALHDAYGQPAEDYRPDAALINYYGRAGTETRGRPYTDIELRTGDLFVFGGPSRFAYHGVPKTFFGTADPASGLTFGRLNLTLRETGL